MKDGIAGAATPNVLLADGESWFLVLNSSYSATYNVRTGVTTTKASSLVFNINPGLEAASDPESDNILIPNGAGALASSTAILYDHGDKYNLTLALLDVPSYGYSIVWSTSAKAAFIFGGLVANTPTAFFGRWVSSGINTWQRIGATPDDPSAREMACMVPAYNGTKLILFGGRTATASLGDIYLYDVLKSKWSPGAPGGTGRARSSHVCAVSGDMFLAWGGVKFTSEGGVPLELTSVYNLATNTWVDKYEAPPIPTTSVPKTATATTSSNSNSPTVPVPSSEPEPQQPRAFERYGIPVIAVVAVALVAGLLFWLYHRKKARKNEAPPPSHAIIPLDRQYDNDKNNNYILPPNSGSPHFPKPPLTYNTKQESQQPIAAYAAPPYPNNGHNPESVYRQPQGNEVQAHELLLQEYEGRRQRQLEEQRDLEQRIERHRVELQMIKDQQRESSSTQGSTPSLDRRGPQYWSMGSSGDRALPDAGWSQPQQTRGAQLYRQSRLG